VIREIYPLIDKACNFPITVSIHGETGTGKEVLAKTIHENSDRSDQSFVAVNMAAIPSELIESELFGHEKGSFTGAQDKRIGKFEEANHGTIFLDEIGDLDFQMQAKLLRVLQEKEVTRVGGNSSIKLDLRIITATHKNLLEEVHKGTFREDLYYRLLGISIQLPPLRERGNDVILLAEEFIEQFALQNKVARKSLSEPARMKLLSHRFPGNVRELKSLIELAMVLSDNSEIEAEDLQIQFTDLKTELLSKETTLKEYNEQIIQHYLDKYNHKVRLVADKLGISKSGIYRMLGQNNAQISA
jgi:two-component system response regulator AtoC